MKLSSKFRKAICAVVCSAFVMSVMTYTPEFFQVSDVYADENIAHDPSRNVQEEGVGNPFNYGERNTPANASVEEIRAINHAMSVHKSASEYHPS